MSKKIIIIYLVLLAFGVGVGVLVAIQSSDLQGSYNNPLGTLSNRDTSRATWRGHEDEPVHKLLTTACLRMVRKLGTGIVILEAVGQCQCILFEMKGDIPFETAKKEFERIKPSLEWGNQDQKDKMSFNNEFVAWFQREGTKIKDCLSSH
jgi:hypothetical protein